MNDKENELLRKISKMTNISKTANLDDLQEMSDAFIAVMGDVKMYLEKNIEVNKGEYNKKIEDCIYLIKETELRVGKLITEARQSSLSDIKDLARQMSAEIEHVRNCIPSLPDMPDLEALEKKIDAKIKAIKIPTMDEIGMQLPKYGPRIRDGLELITEESEKLDQSAIRDLVEELEKIRKEIAELRKGKGNVTFVGGGGSGGGRAMRSYDLFSQLDGVTSTFNIPAVWRVISVHSSSFPFSFRETVDYTWTSTTITFTSQIDPAVTLASGQTVTVVYSEP